jgi:long-chain fatty acid transport protein
MKTILSTSLLIFAGLYGAQVCAAGFQLQEQTASGLGLAYSGMPVAAQDAGVAFWNPAAMPLLSGMQVAAALHYIDTSFDFRSSGPAPAGSTYNALGDGGNAGSGTPVPALYATTQLGSNFAAGLAINAPFGLKTEWAPTWAGMFSGVESEVETLNINPTVGYRFNEHFFLGAGVSYQRLKATLSNGVTPLAPTALGRLEGDDWAFGWNAGALYQSNSGTRVGVTYRSAVRYSITGDLTFNSPAFAALASDVAADLKLPQIVAVGVSQEFGMHTRVLADVTWTGWDSVQALTVFRTSGPLASQVVSNTPLNFRNSWRGGLGLEQQLDATWLLRLGVAYDRSPVQDAFRTPRLPDANRKWLAAGTRFQPNRSLSVDVGYAHLWVREASSSLSPVGAVPGALRGTYVSSSDVVAAQVTVRFAGAR